MTKKTSGTFPLTIEIEGEDVEALCDFTYYPGSPAKINGPPEDCYPEEGEEVEFENLRTAEESDMSEWSTNLDFLRDILSPSFEENLEKKWQEWRIG